MTVQVPYALKQPIADPRGGYSGSGDLHRFMHSCFQQLVVSRHRAPGQAFSPPRGEYSGSGDPAASRVPTLGRQHPEPPPRVWENACPGAL